MVKIPVITINQSTVFFTGKDFLWSEINPFSIITGTQSADLNKTYLVQNCKC